MQDSLEKYKYILLQNWANYYCFSFCFVFSSFAWGHGVTEMVLNITAACSPLFDLCSHWPFHYFWYKWTLSPPPNTFTVDFPHHTLLYPSYLTLYQSLLLESPHLSYIVHFKNLELFLQTSFLLLSIASMPSWWFYLASRRSYSDVCSLDFLSEMSCSCFIFPPKF